MAAPDRVGHQRANSINKSLGSPRSAQVTINAFKRLPDPSASTGSSNLGQLYNLGHARNHSYSSQSPIPSLTLIKPGRRRSTSLRNQSSSSATFAPKFITAQGSGSDSLQLHSIEGENDFSGKRYVWLKDGQGGFLQGWVVEERDNGRILVQSSDGQVHISSCGSALNTDYRHCSNSMWLSRISTEPTPPNSTRRTTWPI